MGLLDDFAAALPNLLPDDPDKREAAKMGLLNFGATMLANANHGFGTSLGTGLVSGAQAYQTGIKDNLELQQKRMQGAWQKQLMGELSGTPTGSVSAPQAALAHGAQAGSIGPTVQNAAMMSQMPPAQQAGSPSLKTLQVGALLGMKNIEPMFNMLKYQQDGIERKPGSFYRNPTTGQEEYISDPTKGFNYDPTTKTVTPITGYNGTIAAQEGAKTSAQEEAKSKFALLPTSYVGVDGRPIGGTISDYIGNQGAPAPQVPQRPAAPRTATPQNFPSVSPAEQQGRDGEAYKIIQAEYAAEKDPTNKAALGRELFRLAGKTGGRPVLQSEAEKTAQVGAVQGRQTTNNELNKNWITLSYNPVVEAGRSSQAMLANLDALQNIDLSTGWGTEAKAGAANFLSSLGIAPKSAELFATNAQKFQSVAMDRLMTTLQAQKGPQTEGDATRAQATFAQLQNTPEANKFIADFARAKANNDARKAQFYQEAMPIAQQTGDMNEVDRRWAKMQGSIWNDPVLQKWKGKK